MAKRRERVRQCRQIRELIQENKYTKALELIDELPLDEVGSLDDLYLYAEMYEKAEHIDKKKQIYYMIYERTKSRHVLNKLLRLVIRMGDMEEAKELYFTYEMQGKATLDTYELRYLVAKAEGEPRSRLIEILEELKREEYTEEWGFQLARLYEQEGLRDKCIAECKRLKLWFGEGKIVDKAVALQKHCEDPMWEPPSEEEIPEPEEPDVQEMAAYAAPAVAVTEMEELPEIPSFDEQEIEREEILSELPPVIEAVSEPVVVKKAEPAKRSESKPEQKTELPEEEESEDISQRGIRYRTLKSVIRRLRRSEDKPHFVFAGGEERITLAVAKRVTKELNQAGHVVTHSIAKISAEKLNQIDLASQMDKIRGGCMLVLSAPEISEKAVRDLLEVVKNEEDKFVVMLSGPFDEMDCFLEIYPELSDILTYKVRM